MYIPGHLELHFMLAFDDGEEERYTQALIREWRTVFRGVRRHRDVPDDVLHYHKSRGRHSRSLVETIVVRGGLSVFFTASADPDALDDEFELGLERVQLGLEHLPELPFVQIRSSLEVALDAPEGRTSLTGAQVYWLPNQVRWFGDDYNVSVAFRWKVRELAGGTIVATILPMDSESRHVHCRYSIYSGGSNEGLFAPLQVVEGISLLRRCFAHAPHLVAAVHLNGDEVTRDAIND